MEYNRVICHHQLIHRLCSLDIRSMS